MTTMADEAFVAALRGRARELSRQELEDSYVEAEAKYADLAMRRAEIRGPIIEEMRWLLHNARAEYTSTLRLIDGERSAPLRITLAKRDEIEDAIRSIDKVLAEFK
jgi:hypothetical protein